MQTFDITAVLDALGLEYSVRGNEATALCPGHKKTTGKEDHSPSWWINIDTGVHMCFSCGYKGNLYQLVCDVKEFYLTGFGANLGYDYPAAQEWVSTVSEYTIEQMLEHLQQLPSYLYSSSTVLEMSEARLAVFSETVPEEQLAKRQLSPDAVKAYGVLWDTNKQAWILPLREPHFNKLMGWQEKGTIDRTFFNRPAGLQRSKTMFGVENQNEEIVIVVESPLDCLRIYTAGIAGAVAVCGSTISADQIKLIRYSKKVVAAFDNPNLDQSGRKASKEMLEYARKYGLNLFFFNYGSSGKKDPGDMTEDEIRWGVENAQSALLGELAYVQGDTKTVSG